MQFLEQMLQSTEARKSFDCGVPLQIHREIEVCSSSTTLRLFAFGVALDSNDNDAT
jgi:hypothetical protein